MMTTIDPLLLDAIRDLVAELAAANYAGLEADGRAGRVPAEALQRVVQEYGRTLLPLPSPLSDEAVKGIDIYETRSPGISGVDVVLWTVEEGRSDLTLQVRATKTDRGYDLKIWDLHVL